MAADRASRRGVSPRTAQRIGDVVALGVFGVFFVTALSLVIAWASWLVFGTAFGVVPVVLATVLYVWFIASGDRE